MRFAGGKCIHIWHIWPYLAYSGAYLGAQNMVKRGVLEKILQNAVQAELNRTLLSKVMTKSSFWPISPL